MTDSTNESPPDYEEHRPELVRAAKARIGSTYAGRVDASGVVQEVLIELWAKQAEGVDLPELRRRVKNKVIDAVRRLSAAKRGGATPPARLGRSGCPIDPAGDGPTPSREAVRREVVDLLGGPSGLSGPEAAVLRAYYLEGRSYREVADHLGVPLGSVGGLLACGLKKLRVRYNGGA